MRIVVEEDCVVCCGEGDHNAGQPGPTEPCRACDGLGFTRRGISLEDFAKLFMPMTVTDGRTYTRSVLVPVPQGSEGDGG